MCRKISEFGLSLLKDGDGILTHCNAGELATSKYGTGLGPLILGKEKGYNFHVFSDETRPLLQGARLTSYELEKAGIDVTLICDNMASLVMKKGLLMLFLSAVTELLPMAILPIKSAQAVLPSWQSITAYRFMFWDPIQLLISTHLPGKTLSLKSVNRMKSNPCFMKCRLLCLKRNALILPLMLQTTA